MKKLKLRPVPDFSKDPLPFAPNEKAAGEWLRLLMLNDSYEACKKLTIGLYQLKAANLDLRLHFMILNRMALAADEFVTRLESSYVDCGMPITHNELIRVETVVWIYSLLENNFITLGKLIDFADKSWPTQDKIKLLYWPLYAANRILLHTSQVYATVSEQFWLRCYQNYSRAEFYGIENQEVTGLLVTKTTISKIFKQLLIFFCLDTEQFRPRNLKKLHNLAGAGAEWAAFNDQAPELSPGIFYLNLMRDAPPERCVNRQIPQHNQFDRYLNVFQVAVSLHKAVDQQRNPSTPRMPQADIELFLRVANALVSKSQKRRYTRLATMTQAQGSIGFNNIVALLAKNEGVNNETFKVPAKVSPFKTPEKPKEKFNLLNIGEEELYAFQQKRRLEEGYRADRVALFSTDAAQNSGPNSDWLQIKTEPETSTQHLIEHFEIRNSSLKGYGLDWMASAQRIKIGDIFSVEQEDGKRFEIGLVCRVTSMADQSLRLGIELIGMESKLAWLEKNHSFDPDGEMVIFIPEISAFKQPDSLIINAGLFKPGEECLLRKEQNAKSHHCRLGRLLHTTPAIDHFELIYIENIW